LHGDLPIARLLLAHGADPNIEGEYAAILYRWLSLDSANIRGRVQHCASGSVTCGTPADRPVAP
jgi:hypothetical protein